MTEPVILVLHKPVKLATTDASRVRLAPAAPERFRTAKARNSFQPVDQVLDRLDLAKRARAYA
ncbi:MAG: hypothetical protein OEM24_03090 [Paracoccaceae bacterium]|nr:hypothetical protein [Paracoccaceae bacterium]